MPLLARPLPIVDEAIDSLDQEIRENPRLEERVNATELPRHAIDGYSAFPFIDLKANKIELNGADWSGLRGKFSASADTLISIVHIGDSHIQAEGATSRTRELLQERFGNAGRGLVIPFKLAGTNQPRDYAIASSAKYTVAKILKRPWPVEMGFTGISLRPDSKRFAISITTKPVGDTEQEFELVKVFGHGHMPCIVSVWNRDVEDEAYEVSVDTDTILIYLSEPTSETTIEFQSQGQCEIFGFFLDNLMMGVQYSAIGNNGATYSSYNSIGTVGQGIAAMSPDLVIISLGTNEAFGKIDTETFYNNIDVLVKNIRRANPQAKFLLVTPSECQKSSSRRIGKGKRRRTEKTFAVNANIPRLRQAVLKYGRDHGIATWDWYAVAGGQGSSDKWVASELMAKDRIHNNWSGYALQGNLLYDAIIDVIEQ